MANHKSAIKRNRQNEKIRLANRNIRSACRTVVAKAKNAIRSGDLSLGKELVKKAESLLAKAANKGIYHRNNVSRKIHRLHKLMKTATS